MKKNGEFSENAPIFDFDVHGLKYFSPIFERRLVLF